MNSRRKGKVGELEFAKYLRERGHEARRGQQFSGGGDSPDVVSSISGVHLEVKRKESFNAYECLAQAIEDAGQKMPVVVHRRNHKEWIAVLRVDDLMKLIEGNLL